MYPHLKNLPNSVFSDDQFMISQWMLYINKVYKKCFLNVPKCKIHEQILIEYKKFPDKVSDFTLRIDL